MNIISQAIRLIRSGLTSGGYYKAMNQALWRINEEYTMLHYPLYMSDSDTFLQSQTNLTDFCISKLGDVKNKRILEIGCGNGVQSMYILRKYMPANITGVDLSSENIAIANRQKESMGIENARFLVDDAQNLRHIDNEGFDVVLNIESAFHYPDKPSFLKELYRVLKPGGQFLIADVLTKRIKTVAGKKFWKKRMVLHHWKLDNYLREFPVNKLTLTNQDDITINVIRGFRNYPNWLRQMRRKNFLSDLAFRIFYIVNIRLNIHLLRTKRQYLVFAGIKPPYYHR